MDRDDGQLRWTVGPVRRVSTVHNRGILPTVLYPDEVVPVVFLVRGPGGSWVTLVVTGSSRSGVVSNLCGSLWVCVCKSLDPVGSPSPTHPREDRAGEKI